MRTLAALALLVSLAVGCGRDDGTNNVPDASAQPPNTSGESDWVVDRADETAPGVDLDTAMEQAEEEGTDESFIGGIRQLVESSPVFRDTEGVQESLAEADRTLREIKDENLAALRGASRQVMTAPWPPNIVLVVADDLAHGDLGCYGQQQLRTPRLDQMASEGVRFAQFYESGSTSEASWWCLMTGQYLAHRGTAGRSSRPLSPAAITLPEVMWQAGYDTAFIGNWYLAGNTQDMPHLHGFDEWSGTLAGESQVVPFPESIWSDGTKATVRANADGQAQVFVQDFLVDEAISFLRRREKKRPFFLMTALPGPRVRPAEIAEEHASQDWPTPQKRHATAVNRLDSDVGRILDELDRLSLTPTTAVFVTSDNGLRFTEDLDPSLLNRSGGLRWSRGSLFEGAIRVPLIARYPKHISAGTVVDEPAAIWDLLPTCVTLGRATRQPTGLDGVSLAANLLGKPSRKRGRLYWERRQGGFTQAVRIGPWKAVRPANKMRTEDIELYQVEEDPAERNNVAQQHPDIVAQTIHGKG